MGTEGKGGGGEEGGCDAPFRDAARGVGRGFEVFVADMAAAGGAEQAG